MCVARSFDCNLLYLNVAYKMSEEFFLDFLGFDLDPFAMGSVL